MTEPPTHDAADGKEQVKPFHARDVSTGEEAAEAVAAVLKHAAERDEAAARKATPSKQPRWMLPVGLNLGVLAVYLLIAPPAWVVLNPITPPPDAERVEDLRTAMFFATSKIDGFRASNGRLPATLAEAGVTYEGIDYVRRGDTAYVLVSNIGDQTVAFDSAVDTAAELVGDLSGRIGG